MTPNAFFKQKTRRLCLQLTLCLVSCFATAANALSPYYLQVGVFHDAKNSRHLIDKLHQLKGLSVDAVARVDDNRHVFIVVIEGFRDKAAALKLKKTLSAKDLPVILKRAPAAAKLYRFTGDSVHESMRVAGDLENLHRAIDHPEWVLDHGVHLPIAPNSPNKLTHPLSIRDALLLALRYNPNIQNAELNRIVERFQLRIAENNFEFQYALTGNTAWQQTTSGGARNDDVNAAATPELSLNTPLGGNAKLTMTNPYQGGAYQPALNVAVSQPLLRDFGPTVTMANLRNAVDTDFTNRLKLRQAIIDQVTSVIFSYRSLITSNNTLETARRSLIDAKKTYEINQKKIAAGQLAPTGNIQQAYQVSSLNLAFQQAKNRWQIDKQSLLSAIGLDPEMRVSVPEDVIIEHLTVPPLKKTIDYALTHNTAYVNQVVALRSIERAYQVAQNQQLWQLNLTANYRHDLSQTANTGIGNTGFGRNNSKSVSLDLSIPINDLPRKQQLISAKVAMESARIQLVAAKRALITQVKNALINIDSQVSQYQLATKQLALANQSYALELKKQAAGIASSLDVTNTQNQLINARNGLIAVKIAYLNEVSTLEKILGTTLFSWGIKTRF